MYELNQLEGSTRILMEALELNIQKIEVVHMCSSTYKPTPKIFPISREPMTARISSQSGNSPPYPKAFLRNIDLKWRKSRWRYQKTLTVSFVSREKEKVIGFWDARDARRRFMRRLVNVNRLHYMDRCSQHFKALYNNKETVTNFSSVVSNGSWLTRRAHSVDGKWWFRRDLRLEIWTFFIFHPDPV